jgi:hypothetical protein
MQTRKKGFSEKLLTVFSDIKVSKWPLFMVYRPRNFAIKGNHTREVLKLVKPGDILVRSFNGYLNNYFIPGTFKHVGFYLSEVTEHHLKQFAEVENPTQFKTGRQMVIYALGDKIVLEDLIDFCRCDGLAVMRFPRQLKSFNKRQIPDSLLKYFEAPTGAAANQEGDEKTSSESEDNAKAKKAKKDEPAKEKTNSKAKKAKKDEPAKEPVKLDATTKAIVENEKKIAQYLAQGKVVEFEKIFKILYRIAIRELGTPYDYDFGMEFFCTTTRSTEFVYFITKSICWNYGIEPERHRLFFKQRTMITPDAFVDGDLEEVWKSDM